MNIWINSTDGIEEEDEEKARAKRRKENKQKIQAVTNKSRLRVHPHHNASPRAGRKHNVGSQRNETDKEVWGEAK